MTCPRRHSKDHGAEHHTLPVSLFNLQILCSVLWPHLVLCAVLREAAIFSLGFVLAFTQAGCSVKNVIFTSWGSILSFVCKRLVKRWPSRCVLTPCWDIWNYIASNRRYQASLIFGRLYFSAHWRTQDYQVKTLALPLRPCLWCRSRWWLECQLGGSPAESDSPCLCKVWSEGAHGGVLRSWNEWF